MKCIVKVQRPLDGPGPLLIYDQQRHHVTQQGMTAKIRDQMKHDYKAFFTAQWLGNRWAVFERVPGESW